MPHQTAKLRDEILTDALQLHCVAHELQHETNLQTFQHRLFLAATNCAYCELAPQLGWTFAFYVYEFFVVIGAERTQAIEAAHTQLTQHAWALLRKAGLDSLMPELA